MLHGLLRMQFLKKFHILLLLGAFCFLLSLYTLLPRRTSQPVQILPHNVNHSEIDDFWVTLESHLREAKPNCPRIKANNYCSLDARFRSTWFERLFSFGACNRRDMTFRPGEHEKPRADHVRLNDESFDCMKSSHTKMITAARSLSSGLPYKRGTSGIVMVGGGKYNFLVLLSLRMLRLSGSNVPVEVFLISSEEYDPNICEVYLPSLNATCRLLSDTLSATPEADGISQYQYKSFAILFSSFENVFFLDADALVASQPDDIFTSEPFISTGLVTWPDLWAESSSPIFFQIAGLPVSPIQRFSTDSGVLLYSKAKHASSLLLATYYNYYGPNHYYPLLSQGAHGQGDKETYLHAAAAMRMEFWDVKTPLWEIGQWLDHSTFQRVGMGQHNPKDDFQFSPQDIFRNHHKVRPLVLHINNPWKLIPSSMFRRWKSPTRHDGKQIRILGTKEDMIKTFGHDIEALMWGQVKHVACDLQIGCDEVKAYYENVFGKEPVTSI